MRGGKDLRRVTRHAVSDGSHLPPRRTPLGVPCVCLPSVRAASAAPITCHYSTLHPSCYISSLLIALLTVWLVQGKGRA